MEPSSNPLLQLDARKKENLSDLLRTGQDLEAINVQLQEWKQPPTTRKEIDEFFRIYSKDRWTRRIDLAAQEAETILTLVRNSGAQIPEAVLAALGQTAFSKIASGKIEGGDLIKYTTLFIRAKEQDRSERSLAIEAEKATRAHRSSTEKALEALARELENHPTALVAFQNLRNQLLDSTAETSEASHA